MSEENVRQITLFDRGTAQFQAYINMCIVSQNRYGMSDGSFAHELYYLSMFGPRGSGTSINAVFAGLVSQSARHIDIDGIGQVALMHKSDRIAGYAPGWSCDITEFGTNRAIHAVVESSMLSLWDPSKAVKSRRKGSKGESVTAKAGEMSEKVEKVIERRPMFLLMVPNDMSNHGLHLAYLDKRCPFPLIDEWSEFLWDRAHQTPEDKVEIEKLHVWNYEFESATEKTVPMIQEAYFCYPDIAKMVKDLSEHIKGNDKIKEENAA